MCCFVGHAEGEGIRSAVSEAGDQLVKRWTTSRPKSTYLLLCIKVSIQSNERTVPKCWTYLIRALQDKKYATDKYKDIYTELSIVKAKAERDLGRLREQLQLAHEALGEPSPEEVQRGGYGKTPERAIWIADPYTALQDDYYRCCFLLYLVRLDLDFSHTKDLVYNFRYHEIKEQPRHSEDGCRCCEALWANHEIKGTASKIEMPLG